jgi:hypothetical protein
MARITWTVVGEQASPPVIVVPWRLVDLPAVLLTILEFRAVL